MKCNKIMINEIPWENVMLKDLLISKANQTGNIALQFKITTRY
jgi:hypothetical protein